MVRGGGRDKGEGGGWGAGRGGGGHLKCLNIPYKATMKFPYPEDQNSVCIILTRVVGGWVGGRLEFDFIAISAQLDWDLG